MDAHHVAALVSFGATAVCPYVALQFARTTDDAAVRALPPDLREQQLVHAIELGLLKVMSKMGISVVRSYQSARLFSALGIGPGLVREFFPGLYSPVGGIEISVRYITQANQRFQLRTKLNQAAVELLGRRGITATPVSPPTPTAPA